MPTTMSRMTFIPCTTDYSIIIISITPLYFFLSVNFEELPPCRSPLPKRGHRFPPSLFSGANVSSFAAEL